MSRSTVISFRSVRYSYLAYEHVRLRHSSSTETASSCKIEYRVVPQTDDDKCKSNNHIMNCCHSAKFRNGMMLMSASKVRSGYACLLSPLLVHSLAGTWLDM
jgi:hypothetical protein